MKFIGDLWIWFTDLF